MSTINVLGPVGYNPTGTYDPTRAYEKLDVVYYQGSSYVATNDSIGQLPTNTEYWDCIAIGYPLLSGNTVSRPISDLSVGLQYFDTTLGYPIWYNGEHWVNASGDQV